MSFPIKEVVNEQRLIRPPVQNKKYSIIYADPPWRYKVKRGRGTAESHYPTMSIEEICALPVTEIAAADCALFLWGTFPQLKAALQVIESWGFSYKTLAFLWLKQNRKSDTWFYGMGFWTRSNAEVCLLATRGHPTTRRALVQNALSLVGKVPYFWGGKSGPGWNEEWGTPKLVTSAGSASSGQLRPYAIVEESVFTDDEWKSLTSEQTKDNLAPWDMCWKTPLIGIRRAMPHSFSTQVHPYLLAGLTGNLKAAHI